MDWGFYPDIMTDPAARKEQIERFSRTLENLRQSGLSILGLIIISSVIFSAIFAPYIAPYPEDAEGAINFDQKNEPPSFEHPMGTDTVGRDILSRVIFGARISLFIVAVVLSLAVTIGVILGVIAGYLGGYVNAVIMRTTDVFLSIPAVLLALAVTAAIGPSLTNSMIAISFAWWPWYSRLVQGEVLSIKEEEFVEASESLGASWHRVAFKEILPNVIAPITVKITLDAGFVILVGASLGFLGLGAQPPTPDWGVMIAQGRNNLTNFWWIATFPGLAISYSVLGFNLMGDGLRDVFDVEVNQ